jgi:maltooligosyltrehalose trehalohydrolase
VIYSQNHDQVANASHGLRHGALLPPAQQKLAAALLLCAPCVPLLFMGQEYGEIAPFHYFTSHGDEGLARLVTEGRRAEIEEFGNGQACAGPQAPETFAESRLNWALAAQPRHHALLDWYRRLIALRRAHAALGNCRMDLTQVHHGERARWITLGRSDPSGEAAVLICNLSGTPGHVPLSGAEGHWRRELWSGGTDGPNTSGGAGEPPAELHGGAASRRNVPLEGWGAVLYLRGAQA